MGRSHKVLGALFLFFFVGLLVAGDPWTARVRADEGPGYGGRDETDALHREIQILKDRLQTLERRLERAESQAAAKPSYTPPAPAPTTGFQLPEALEGLTVSGFVDTAFTYNLEQPGTRTNSLRAFDQDAESFTPHLVEIALEKPATTDSPVGFRVDLDFGDDAEQFGSTGLGSTTDEFELEQAYVTAKLPVGNDLDVAFGKFVTLLGGEVIESKDNWNYSRSFLFFYAIPFTHTGVRMSYPVNDALTLTAGVNNGWDMVDDINHGKSVEAQVAYAFMDNASLTVTNIVGPEQADNSDNFRDVVDVILTYDPTEKLSLMANADYGFEEDGVSVGNDAEWYGVAAYGRYQLTEMWAVALRGEYFRDQDGTRTGTIQKLWEVTATNELVLYGDDLIARLEYRHDKSDEKSFKNGEESYQNTVALELIYSF